MLSGRGIRYAQCRAQPVGRTPLRRTPFLAKIPAGMGIIRLLLVLAAGWLVIAVFRNWRARHPRRSQSRLPRRDKMVRCAYCGVHVPVADAITLRGDSFCSEAHKDAQSQRGDG